VGGERNGPKSLYAGVYDGHAGWAMSAVLKHVLIRYVSTSLGHLPASADDETVAETIQTAFETLDNRVMNHAQKALEGAAAGNPEALAAVAPAIAGSCALLAVYDPSSSTLRTAVTGDSRAVLGSWSAATVQSDSNRESKGNFTAEQLTIDQTGFNAAEVARLQVQHPGEGPDMINSDSGRLFGLAVTRAFGDHRWKWPQDLIKAAQTKLWSSTPRPKADRSPPYLTARPEVTTSRVQPATDFVILASDGLWDVMSNDDAVICVERWLAARGVGKPEAQAEVATKGSFTVDEDGYGKYRATPEHFAIEDLDNAAVCLAKNAFGGRRRDLFRGVMTAYSPLSRDVRDDVTIQVIFFQTPPGQA
jgi:pyruvate dehydrogenase phosphatase